MFYSICPEQASQHILTAKYDGHSSLRPVHPAQLATVVTLLSNSRLPRRASYGHTLSWSIKLAKPKWNL